MVKIVMMVWLSTRR